MARNKLIDLNNHLFEALEAEKYKNEFGRGASLPLMIENAK